MKAHQKPYDGKTEWLTPPWILKRLGNFDLDPCAAVGRPWDVANQNYTINVDGLTLDWYGRIWLNPPFERRERPKWMKKMAEHNHGTMIVPAACETEAFRQYVFGAASGILMLDKRPHYCGLDGREVKFNSGCTMCLVSYGKQDLARLIESGLGTVLVEI